jgi:hypothetical protein
VQDLSAFNSFVALNQAIALSPDKLMKLKELLIQSRLDEAGRPDTPRRDIRGLLRELTVQIIGTPELSIPFGGESRAIDDRSIYNILNRIRGTSSGDIRAIQSEMRGYGALIEHSYQGLPAGAVLPPPEDTRSAARIAADEARAPRPVVSAPEVRIGADVGRAAPAITGGETMIGADVGRAAPPEGGGRRQKSLSQMNKTVLQTLATSMGLQFSATATNRVLRQIIQRARNGRR